MNKQELEKCIRAFMKRNWLGKQSKDTSSCWKDLKYKSYLWGRRNGLVGRQWRNVLYWWNFAKFKLLHWTNILVWKQENEQEELEKNTNNYIYRIYK